MFPEVIEIPTDVFGGKFSAFNSSIKFHDGSERLRFSVPDDILKLVCKFVIKFKI